MKRKMTIRAQIMCVAVVAALGAWTANAQTLEVSWYTVDGGGAMNSTGGSLAVSGTVGQTDAGGPMTGGNLSVVGGFWTAAANTGVSVFSANPPIAASNPYQPGQPYTDVLDTGAGSGLTAGIGAAGTQPQGGIEYSPIHVTFSTAPTPVPAPANVTVSCVGGSSPCPAVQSVIPGAGTNEYLITLTSAIPPLSCATISFSGSAAGQKLQYRSNPGNVNLDNFGANTQDLAFLVARINDGTANLPQNIARYNINRSALQPPHVNTQDLLRLVQLLNGINTTQVFNGAIAATCP
ncbi:MAG TPA: hypothetical protein VGM03_11500 [Phycisphaerae bacterium]|jgi:hypothetical protein